MKKIQIENVKYRTRDHLGVRIHWLRFVPIARVHACTHTYVYWVHTKSTVVIVRVSACIDTYIVG